MRLPGLAYKTGVKPLGREDVAGPLRVGRAGMQLANATSEMLAAAGDVGMQFYEANAAAEYDRAMGELARREAEMRNLLTSGPVLDTRATPPPDWLELPTEKVFDQTTGTTVTRTARFVPMHEIATEVYDGTMTRLQEHALATTSNPLARSQLRRKMVDVAAAGAPKVQKAQLGFFRDQQLALVDVAIDEHIQAGNEQQAKAALSRAFATGLLKPEDYAERMQAIGLRVDEQDYNNMLFAAETEGELELVREDIAAGIVRGADGKPRRSRLDPEMQWKLRGRAETLEKERDREADEARKAQMRVREDIRWSQSQADRRRTERQREGNQTTAEQYLNGELTERMVLEKLERGDISPSQAYGFREKLAEGPEYLRPDPEGLDYYRRRIRTLRYLESGQRVSERATALEKTLQAAVVGLDDNGSAFRGWRLDGENFATLMKELRDEMNVEQSNPDYKHAVEQMRGATGVTPGMFAGMETTQKALAFADFKKALDDYVDRYGSEADPLRFVAEQREFFNPTDYAGEDLAAWREVYGARFQHIVPEEWGEDELTPTQAEWYRRRVKAETLKMVRRGDLDFEDAKVLIIQLRAEHLPQTLDDYALIEDVTQ